MCEFMIKINYLMYYKIERLNGKLDVTVYVIGFCFTILLHFSASQILRILDGQRGYSGHVKIE